MERPKAKTRIVMPESKIAVLKPQAKTTRKERIKLEEKVEKASKFTPEQKEGFSLLQEELLSQLPSYDITGVFTAVVDPKFIRSASVTPNGITRTFEEGKETSEFTDTIFDRRMGASDLHSLCGTCRMDRDADPGHNGHINLEHRCYHVGYFGELLLVLNCFCRDCGTLLMDEDIIRKEVKFNNAIGATKLRRISEESTRYTCRQCKKRKYAGKIDAAKSKSSFKIKIKRGPDHIEMPIDAAYEMLKNVPDETFRLLGYPMIRDRDTGVPITTHPKNYIAEAILVMPPYIRPNIYRGKEAELSPESKLYNNIVKTNATIKDVKKYLERNPGSMEKKQELDRLVDTMTQYIGSLVDSEKYGNRVMHGVPLKGMKQRIQGKEAYIREKMQSKVTDFVSRHVVRPDPTLEVGQVSLPKSLMREQTRPEKVYGGNIAELTKLLRLGLVTAIVPGSGPRKGILTAVTAENMKTMTLEPGDDVHRRLRNGDVVINNRYPSIQMYSMLAHTGVSSQQENLGHHMSATKAYNMDFDGDEGQTHIPQTTGALADSIALLHVRRNMINVQSSRPLFGGFYDVPVATTMLSYDRTTISYSDFSNVVTRLVSQDQLFTLFSRLQRHNQPISKPVPLPQNLAPLLELYLTFVNDVDETFINASNALNAFMNWLDGQNRLKASPTDSVQFDKARRDRVDEIDPDFVRNYFPDIAEMTINDSRLWRQFIAKSENKIFNTYEDAHEAYTKLTQSTFSLKNFIENIAPKYNDQDAVFKLFLTKYVNVLAPERIPDTPVTSSRILAAFHQLYPTVEMEDADILEIITGFLGTPVSLKEFVDQMKERADKQLKTFLSELKDKRGKVETSKTIAEERKEELLETYEDQEKRFRDEIRQIKDNFDALYNSYSASDRKSELAWITHFMKPEKQESVDIEYYGRVLLSAILPAGLSYSEYGVKIVEGVVIDGIWTMDVVGTAHNSLVQAIWDQFGSERAADFLTDLYFMANYVYAQLGMTLAPSDLIVDNPKQMLEIERERTKLYEKFKALSETYSAESDDPLLKEKYEKEVLELTRDFSNLGIKVVDLLDKKSNIAIIAKSKAKGKASNFAQMIVDLQQQMLYGERLQAKLRGGTLTLPYFEPHEKSLESQGFIESSYLKGLSPAQYFQHGLANRQGIVDMQTKTQDVGDDHRRLVKALEDLFIDEDGAVRNRATGAMIQPVFGYHGFNPSNLRLFNTPDGKVAGPIYPTELVNRINQFFN
jgi:DNA-directed RNA polymerase beta' subunit